MAKNSYRAPKSITDEEMSAILAYASVHDDKAASEKFNVSCRTLQRRRKAIADGKAPALAKLVEIQKKEALKRTGDLLVHVWEAGLKALCERIQARGEDRMVDRDLTGAIHILGNQRVVRDSLLDGPDSADSEDATLAEASGREAASKAASKAPSLH